MAIDTNHNLANALLDTFDTEFPAGAILEIRSGAPAGAQNSAGGTLLASITLPSTPWAAAAAAAKAKNGTWQDSSADNTGTAAHFRLRNSGDTRRLEGTVTATGGGGDITIDNTSIASGQVVTVNTFTPTLA